MSQGFDPTQHEFAQWLTRVERNQTHPNQRWRDAATLILLDRSDKVPKVLLGRRHAGHKFLPGRFVFPGGRVERSDGRMPVATPLHAAVEARLLKRVHRPSPAKARAFALAAIRETFEETGLLIGRRQEELLAHALELASRIYAEKPKRFLERVEGYWHAWREPAAVAG